MCHLEIVSKKRSMETAALKPSNIYRIKFANAPCIPSGLKGMVEKGQGKILNMSSLAAFQPGPLMSIYYASKAYILSFSEAIANELKGTGVTVTVLCPGQTKTSFQEVVSQETSENKIGFNMASPDEVAKYGYKAMLNGESVVIPGNFNKFLSFLPRILPRNIAAAIVRKIQEKNREL